MTTIKMKFQASTVEGKKGTLFYQVIHRRQTKQIRTTHKLFPTEWDKDRSAIITPPNTPPERLLALQTLSTEVEADLQLLRCIADQLENEENDYTAQKVAERFHLQKQNGGFIAFAHRLIKELRQAGRPRTAETYATSLNSLLRFRKGNELPFQDINSTLTTAYEGYLRSQGLCLNTSSFYMRNLRAIYNRAVEQELTPQRHPFRHVYTGVGKTVKRAVPLQVIRQLRDLDLTERPDLDFARDIFLFSFYTRGMSFVDIAFLRKTDLKGGILTYRRRKTHQRLSVKWEKPMQAIIDKYDTGSTPYLLPIIQTNGKDELRQYRTAAHLVNNKLRKIGQLLDLSDPLTTYVARHGWATVAKDKRVPLSVISEAMGHDSERTTRIYLASLDTSSIDRANRLILDSL